MECKNCLNYVNIHDHQCHIMSEEDRIETLEERSEKRKEECRCELKERELENGELMKDFLETDDESIMSGMSVEEEEIPSNPIHAILDEESGILTRGYSQ